MPPDKPLHFISGMCLFGAEGLMGITVSGKRISLTDPFAPVEEKILTIKELPVLHPSETESLLLIPDTIKSLMVGETSVFFHLPRNEYKFYALEAFQHGFLNVEQVKDLFFRIDRRANAMMKIISKEKRLPQAKIGSPLDGLNWLLTTFEEKTNIEQCLSAIPKNSILEEMVKFNPPKNFFDLNNLSYVAGYIGLAKEASDKGEGFLAVDLPKEEGIFNNSKPLLGQLGLDLPLTVMLVGGLVLTTNGRHGKTNLFMHQSNGASSLLENKIVLSSRRSAPR